jgi:hypothetical protein
MASLDLVLPGPLPQLLSQGHLPPVLKVSPLVFPVLEQVKQTPVTPKRQALRKNL